MSPTPSFVLVCLEYGVPEFLGFRIHEWWCSYVLWIYRSVDAFNLTTFMSNRKGLRAFY